MMSKIRGAWCVVCGALRCNASKRFPVKAVMRSEANVVFSFASAIAFLDISVNSL